MDRRSSLLTLAPQDFYDILDKSVAGNDMAKRQIALMFWNMEHGRRSVNFLIGPTGCGKTEIVRALEKIDHRAVRVVDATVLHGNGWTGNMHLSDVLCSMSEDLEDHPCLLIIDEFDKKVRPAIGGTSRGGIGTDYNRILQDDLLRMCDGDTIRLKSENGLVYVDCSLLSVLFVGAFSDIRERKGIVHHAIGFGSQDELQDTKKKITITDIIRYGMTPELAGRIQRLIQLDEPDLETMKKIAYNTLRDISFETSKHILTSDKLMEQFANDALASGLGARQIRKEIIAILDDLLYEHPDAVTYDLVTRRCRYAGSEACNEDERRSMSSAS